MPQNPLLQTGGLPQFAKISPEHVIPAVEQSLAELEHQLTAIEAVENPTWESVVVPLSQIDRRFEQFWQPVLHLLGVKNSEALRKAHEKALPKVVTFRLKLTQSQPIYTSLTALKNGPEWNDYEPVQQRLLELKIREAERTGVHLQGEAKKRFNEIEKELTQLGADFSNHVLDATKAYALIVENPADAEGWPENLKQIAAQSYNLSKPEKDAVDATAETGPWRISLDPPLLLPFMQHSRNRDHRRELYMALITRASSGEFDNSELVSRSLALKIEKAALLGYSTFAEFSLDDKMAPSVAAVQEMLDTLAQKSRAFAVRELETLRAFAEAEGHGGPLEHWDVAFWAERLREKEFSFTDDELRPWLPLPKVLDGLFGLTERLFNVRAVPADGEASVWHEDVRFFHVIDADDRKVASFYLDPYSRPAEKRGGAWMDDCIGRGAESGALQLPVVHLCCNGSPPVAGRPSLMSFSEVTTLFHEFGHGLQGMLTTVNYTEVAGTRGIEWDAVEIASQFMENWCYEEKTLKGMAKHFETGETLPDDLFQKIVAARTFRAGSNMLRQLEFGVTDMSLHHTYDPATDGSPFELHHRIAEKIGVMSVHPENRFLCAFSHIFAGEYAAGYYSYKWSEVLSADAFAAFEEAGLENEGEIQEIGARYRDTILANGGGRPPMEVFESFRGRKPKPDALLRHSGLA